MPNNNSKVRFLFGTEQEYRDLQNKNSNAFYIATDTHKIFLGDFQLVGKATHKYTIENNALKIEEDTVE